MAIEKRKSSLPITQKAKNSPGKTVHNSGVDLIKNAAEGTRALNIDTSSSKMPQEGEKAPADLTSEEDKKEDKVDTTESPN